MNTDSEQSFLPQRAQSRPAGRKAGGHGGSFRSVSSVPASVISVANSVSDGNRSGAVVFRTIVGADWVVALRRARSAEVRRNVVSDQIRCNVLRYTRARAPGFFLDGKLGKLESGNGGILTTDYTDENG
jgi:hypothetical protein